MRSRPLQKPILSELFSVALIPKALSGPNRAMQPRCAMRFESHTPKSLAMRKVFSLAMRKHIRWIWNHRKMPGKTPAKILRCWPAMRKIRVFLRSSDAKCLRFGLPLQSGLRCERPRCQIASDVGRAMRTTKLKRSVGFPRYGIRAALSIHTKILLAGAWCTIKTYHCKMHHQNVLFSPH